MKRYAMRQFIYVAMIRLYACGIRFASIWHEKARLWVRGRRHWREKLEVAVTGKQEWIWFHCASMGEFEDSCEVVLALQDRMPGYRCLLTFMSPSGYEGLQDSPLWDAVAYLPIDTRRNARDFMEIVRPKVALFSRSELWLHHLSELKSRGIPAFLIGLKLQAKSGFLKRIVQGHYSQCLDAFHHVFCQDAGTHELLIQAFGNRSASVSGNARIDRIASQAAQGKEFPAIQGFSEGRFTVLAGSVGKPEMDMLRGLIPRMRPHGMRWIIVPHEIHAQQIDHLLSIGGKTWAKYSQLPQDLSQLEVIVVDHVGSLRHLYRYAQLAVIGGGFSRMGIHNIIEPAVYGVPVLFGPRHRDYSEALDLMKLGCASIFRNEAELSAMILRQFQGVAHSAQAALLQEYVHSHAVSPDAVAAQIQQTCLVSFGKS